MTAPRRLVTALALAACVILLPGMAQAAFKATLQGQSAGSTNWISQNLMDWRELDYIPCRVLMSGGPANNKTITIDFDHMMGTTPGVENLTGFTYSPNVTVVSGPTLDAPPLGNKWTYTLVVNVANNQPATIEFRARLSAGAHLNTGSSLALGGQPSLGTLQIHKPDAAPGIPDLVINKSGPATAAPGEVITYTINYFNKTNAGNTATGVQITDVITNFVNYVPNSMSANGVVLGRGTLIWDVGSLAPGQAGSLTYQVQVESNAPFGGVFQNYARILSAENDADYSDNVSIVTTTITFNRPPAATNDAYSTNEDTLLTVAAPGILANDTDPDGDTLRAVLLAGPANGTLTLNSNGGFNYQPATNFNGSDSFTYKANDGRADSAPATVTITVLPVNDPPLAVNDAYTLSEDSPLTVAAPGILANDSDVEGSALSATLVAGPTHGTLSLNANGSFTYVPATNYTGPDAFTYKANDGAADSGVATVSLTVLPVNDPPVAENDTYSTPEDTLLTVAAPGVLANDSDVEGPLTAVPVTGPAHGSLTLNPDGSFTYQPATNYHGPDSFTYRAYDGATNSAIATVSITVTPVNDVPVAANDAYTTDEDTLLTVTLPGVLANDSDADGGTLTALLAGTTTNGALSLKANGSFSYQPNSNFHGVDTFTYRASDGTTNSAIATVTITVTPVNDLPVAVNDAYAVNEDTLLSITAPGVLANDSDVEGPLTAALVTGPAHGSLTLNADGSFTYQPATNYNGPDSFTYRAHDGATNSASATVSITVIPGNDTPMAANDAYVTAEDTVLTITSPGVLGNDTDIDGDPLTAVLATNPAHGSLTLNTDGSFSYRPATNYHGPDSFTYRASDGTNLSAVATVSLLVTPVNDAPVAVNDSHTTAEDTQLVVTAPGILANDSDADGDALSAILATGPAHGALSLNANGSFSYTPATNYHGPDSFTYKANDGSADSGITTVSITVTPVNDAPAAVNDSFTTPEDTLLSISAPGILANDTDADADALSAVLVATTTNGVLTLNSNGGFNYRPNSNFHGTDSFTYRANDGSVDSGGATVSISVTPVNDAPVAQNDAFTTTEDTLLTISAPGILANDTDADADALSAVPVATTTNGVLTLNSNGGFNYRPNSNFHGTDSFTYRANDGATNSGVATVTITVTTVNDAPIAANDSYTTTEDTLLTVTLPGVLANDTDNDGDVLSAVLVANPVNGALTLNANGSFTYLPNSNFHGADSFTYKANDGAEDSAAATVSITVTPVNDAPVAVNDSYTTAEDTQLVVIAPGVLANDTDAENNALTAILLNGPAHGTLSLNANGSFTYTPATNYHGADSFTYKANDGAADSGVATVSISVTPVNDAPVAANDNYTTAEDTLLTVTPPGVLANDSDADGDTVSATLVTTTTNGVLSLNATGAFTYQPNSNFHGTDSFTYKANDGTADSSIATVLITVTPVNDMPVAANDSYSALEDVPLTVAAPGVLANDSDAEGTLTAVLVAGPAHGALTLNTNGSFTYTPATNYSGPDSFVYRADDGSTNVITATVSLTVGPVNDAPSFTAGPDQIVPENSGPQLIPAWATNRSPGPADEAGQSLEFLVDNDAPQLFIGQPSINPQGDLFFVPAPGAFGTANVTVRLRDNGGTANGGVDTSAPAVFHIMINTPPVVSIASPTNGSVFLAPATFPLIATASDADGTVTSVELFRGTNSLGVFTNAPYQVPMNNLPVGTYTFTARATDNRGAAGNATPVTISVVAAPPVSTTGTLLNPQVNLFELSVRVDNPTPLVFSAVRVVISNLPPGTIVANASGTNAAGLPFVQFNQPVAPGGSALMVIEYMTPNRQPASPVLTAEIVAPMPPPAPAAGPFVPVTRMGMLGGGRLFIGFDTVPGRSYFIEYSDDLVTWKNSQNPVYAYINFAQWTDTGAPKTVTHPSTVEKRFYRVRLAP